ncbi:MAG: bifunctional phosphoribosylaminoimidazolecarboxamide formyltransferase/IMP cyclohydrolase [Candidatus Wallbacteria bacterium]|nr:bifunctional phosphoribosylaminoimidazolecarboxamide formyltransferase/IMP cyclohydrolase [Candidatus Wallbacteria bacterium]
MNEPVKIRRALISVWAKEGLEVLLAHLDQFGVEFVSSSGTADFIEQQGYKVIRVEDLTGFPEMLGGRVKTLHPAVHAGILAPRTQEGLSELSQNHIVPIDLVVVNLYPFLDQMGSLTDDLKLVEYIDIGGPTLLRAAAKNYRFVTPVPSPDFYQDLIQELMDGNGMISSDFRRRMMVETFSLTASYDAAIAGRFQPFDQSFPQRMLISADLVQTLRYGENPHQKSALYSTSSSGLPSFRCLQGKELSYNNFLDLEAGTRLLKTFRNEPECFTTVLKHSNPCGLALATEPAEAWKQAYAGDPVSAFGGVVITSRPVDGETAALMSEVFLEIIMAPSFERKALEIFSKKKNLRLLTYHPDNLECGGSEFRSINGGLLVQDEDDSFAMEFRSVTGKAASPTDIHALSFAHRTVKHLKSNAICVVRDNMMIGAGCGCVSRVDAAKLALEKAGEKASGAYLASDAFFPFPDCIELAAAAGIRAVVEPGGSLRDKEVIERADSLGLIMVFSGERHFWH